MICQEPSTLKVIDGLRHMGSLVGTEHRTDRQAQLLTVYLLGDGQREVAVLRITGLPVRRYGVMNECLYALLGKMLLQTVAPGTEHREEMIDIGGIGCAARQADHSDDRDGARRRQPFLLQLR